MNGSPQRCQHRRQRHHRELLGDLRTAGTRRDDRPALPRQSSGSTLAAGTIVTNTGVVTWTPPRRQQAPASRSLSEESSVRPISCSLSPGRRHEPGAGGASSASTSRIPDERCVERHAAGRAPQRLNGRHVQHDASGAHLLKFSRRTASTPGQWPAGSRHGLLDQLRRRTHLQAHP